MAVYSNSPIRMKAPLPLKSWEERQFEHGYDDRKSGRRSHASIEIGTGPYALGYRTREKEERLENLLLRKR